MGRGILTAALGHRKHPPPMLSYQHIYHAGNFADVHKHLALVLALRRLAARPGPLVLMDTHAGRGRYDLASAEARKTMEFELGILPLLAAPPASVLEPYLELVRPGLTETGLRYYPGSPELMAAHLREGDSLALCELHPGEIKHLRLAMAKEPRARILAEDGMEKLASLDTPTGKRAFVLIDPSYELKVEFEVVLATVLRRAQLPRCPTMMVWYPVLTTGHHNVLVEGLRRGLKVESLRAELSLRGRGFRMAGSGLVVVHPPRGLAPALEEAGEALCAALAEPAFPATHRVSRFGAGPLSRAAEPAPSAPKGKPRKPRPPPAGR